MHQQPRVFDAIHMYADVIQGLVLLPHLLLHHGLVADIPPICITTPTPPRVILPLVAAAACVVGGVQACAAGC